MAFVLFNLAAVAALVGIDQLIKLWAVQVLQPVGAMPLIPHVVELRFVLNQGMAFSLLSGKQLFLIIATSAALLAVAYGLFFRSRGKRLQQAALVLVLGGGIGIAPLYGLAQRMLEAGIAPTVGLGFRSGGDAFYLEEFGKLGCRLMVATEDGSLGTKGFVTDLVRHVPECGYAFVCGPTPMLKAVHGLPQLTGGQFSFEARMGCGFGACMGCSVPTTNGYKRVCKDGPILYKEEIVW